MTLIIVFRGYLEQTSPLLQLRRVFGNVVASQGSLSFAFWVYAKDFHNAERIHHDGSSVRLVRLRGFLVLVPYAAKFMVLDPPVSCSVKHQGSPATVQGFDE